MLIDLKIIVATHKKYWMPEDKVYLPLQVGAYGKDSLGYKKDSTGDNISVKNKNYCELTGLYWAWKNLDSYYLGLAHYRRHFAKNSPRDVEKKQEAVLGANDFEELLKKAPIILPKRRNYYIETNRSQYEHAHNKEGLTKTKEIIKRKYPKYLEAFEKVMNRTWGHRFNMFVMEKKYFNEYCTWLFDILFTLEKELDISTYDAYNSRVFGFISERLLDVWLEAKQYPYLEQNVCYMEKQNWLIKGSNFLKRKFVGGLRHES